MEASPSEPPTEPRRVARPGEPCNVQTEAFESRKKKRKSGKICERTILQIQVVSVWCEQITSILVRLSLGTIQKRSFNFVHAISCEKSVPRYQIVRQIANFLKEVIKLRDHGHCTGHSLQDQRKKINFPFN